MEDQKRHEMDIFMALVTWLYDERGLLLHSLPPYIGEGYREPYLANIRTWVLEDYVSAHRSMQNQPVWCIRHQMQTCTRCEAIECGDNMTLVKDSQALLQIVASAVVELCSGGGLPHDPPKISSYGRRIRELMRRARLPFKEPL